MESRILIYVSNWLGTSETFIFNQLGAFPQYSFPTIVAVNKRENENILSSDKFDAYFLPDSRFHFYYGILKRKLQIPGNRYEAYPTQKKKINEIIKSNFIELFHAHYGTMGLHILPVAKELKTPLITTFHGNDASKMLQKKAYRKSLRFLFEYQNSYIIAVSNRIRERLIQLGASHDKIQTHYIGTDISRFKFVNREDIREKMSRNAKVIFLQVSNFVSKKGHRETIKAFKKISDLYSNLFLYLGGDGKTKKECESLVKELRLEKKVKFLGRVNPHDVYSLMQKSDYFIHNSITGADCSEEGIPTVLMEAMATGLPVLSTKHAGIPELVKDGITGFLSEEKSLSDYTKNFEKAINSDSKKMGYEAYKHVELNFNLEKQNLKLKKIYNEVLDRSLSK